MSYHQSWLPSVSGMLISIHNIYHHIKCKYSLFSLGLNLNSSPPSVAYIHLWTGSTMIQVMACRLLGAKPLPEPVLVYYQLDSRKFQWNLNRNLSPHSTKCIWKCRLPKWWPFCPAGDWLTPLCFVSTWCPTFWSLKHWFILKSEHTTYKSIERVQATFMETESTLCFAKIKYCSRRENTVNEIRYWYNTK